MNHLKQKKLAVTLLGLLPLIWAGLQLLQKTLKIPSQRRRRRYLGSIHDTPTIDNRRVTVRS
jgi:hypothetical protein